MQPFDAKLAFLTELAAIAGRRPSTVYLVGGTIRDMLMGRTPHDYDLVVPSDPQQLAQGLARATGGRLVVIGRPGRMLYRVAAPKRTYDVTAFQGASIDDDLKNRDFTINAIAFDLVDRKWIDCLNGRGDLAAGTIRLASADALRNDPVRLVRAYRLALELEGTIEPLTLAALKKDAHRISQSAGERIRDELFKILEAPRAADTLTGMYDSGLLPRIFPELTPYPRAKADQAPDRNDWSRPRQGLTRLEYLLDPSSTPGTAPRQKTLVSHLGMPVTTVKLAVLLQDVGRRVPADGAGGDAPPGYARRAASLAAGMAQRLRLTNRQCADLDHLLRHQRKPAVLYRCFQNRRVSRPGWVRFCLNHGPRSIALLVLAMAVSGDKASPAAETGFDGFATMLIDTYLQDLLPAQQRRPLITGDDLIQQFGLPPSPSFKRMLKRVREQQLLGALATRRDALKWLAAELGTRPSGRRD